MDVETEVGLQNDSLNELKGQTLSCDQVRII